MDDQLGKRRDWSSIPSLMLSRVLLGLNNTDTDCRRLRAVCTSWRSSLSPPTPPSLQFPREAKFYLHGLFGRLFEDLDNNVILKQWVFYLISPTKEGTGVGVWLTRVEETLRPDPPNVWKLQSPIWGGRVNSTSPELKAKVNLLDYRVTEVARSVVSYSISSDDPIKNKVAMIPFPKPGATTNSDFSLLALGSLGNLSLSKSGAKDWARISYGFVGDIAACGGTFYATRGMDSLASIHPVTLDEKEIIRPKHIDDDRDYDGLGTHVYLVESCGRLYLVNKMVISDTEMHPGEKCGKPVKFEVYGLVYSRSPIGDANHSWEPVASLGDRVFFLSIDHVSFSLSAEELGWSRGDCIFFSYDESSNCSDESCDHDECDVSKKYSGLCTLEDGRILLKDQLPSEYTKMFWPVPSWLATN